MRNASSTNPTMKRLTMWIGGAALAAMLMTAGPVLGQAPTDGEIRRLTEAYAAAWAKGDAKALAGLHTTEALRIGFDGKVAVGRAAIEQSFSLALNGPYRGSKIGLTPGQTARAAQDPVHGQSVQAGRFGVHSIAPRSISAWA